MLKNQSIAVTEQVPWLSGERHWNSHAACAGPAVEFPGGPGSSLKLTLNMRRLGGQFKVK